MKIITKKKLKEECWNLDYSLVVWLNEHLRVYLEDADKVIDLAYYKFDYEGETYTLKEIIIKLIAITDYLKDKHFADSSSEDLEITERKKDEMYDILKMIHYYLWW